MQPAHPPRTQQRAFNRLLSQLESYTARSDPRTMALDVAADFDLDDIRKATAHYIAHPKDCPPQLEQKLRGILTVYRNEIEDAHRAFDFHNPQLVGSLREKKSKFLTNIPTSTVALAENRLKQFESIHDKELKDLAQRRRNFFLHSTNGTQSSSTHPVKFNTDLDEDDPIPNKLFRHNLAVKQKRGSDASVATYVRPCPKIVRNVAVGGPTSSEKASLQSGSVKRRNSVDSRAPLPIPIPVPQTVSTGGRGAPPSGMGGGQGGAPSSGTGRGEGPPPSSGMGGGGGPPQWLGPPPGWIPELEDYYNWLNEQRDEVIRAEKHFYLRNREEIENLNNKRQAIMKPSNSMGPQNPGEMRERMKKFQEENKSEIEGLENKKTSFFKSRGLRISPKPPPGGYPPPPASIMNRFEEFLDENEEEFNRLMSKYMESVGSNRNRPQYEIMEDEGRFHSENKKAIEEFRKKMRDFFIPIVNDTKMMSQQQPPPISVQQQQQRGSLSSEIGKQQQPTLGGGPLPPPSGMGGGLGGPSGPEVGGPSSAAVFEVREQTHQPSLPIGSSMASSFQTVASLSPSGSESEIVTRAARFEGLVWKERKAMEEKFNAVYGPLPERPLQPQEMLQRQRKFREMLQDELEQLETKRFEFMTYGTINGVPVGQERPSVPAHSTVRPLSAHSWALSDAMSPLLPMPASGIPSVESMSSVHSGDASLRRSSSKYGPTRPPRVDDALVSPVTSWNEDTLHRYMVEHKDLIEQCERDFYNANRNEINTLQAHKASLFRSAGVILDSGSQPSPLTEQLQRQFYQENKDMIVSLDSKRAEFYKSRGLILPSSNVPMEAASGPTVPRTSAGPSPLAKRSKSPQAPVSTKQQMHQLRQPPTQPQSRIQVLSPSSPLPPGVFEVTIPRAAKGFAVDPFKLDMARRYNAYAKERGDMISRSNIEIVNTISKLGRNTLVRFRVNNLAKKIDSYDKGYFMMDAPSTEETVAAIYEARCQAAIVPRHQLFPQPSNAPLQRSLSFISQDTGKHPPGTSYFDSSSPHVQSASNFLPSRRVESSSFYGLSSAWNAEADDPNPPSTLGSIVPIHAASTLNSSSIYQPASQPYYLKHPPPPNEANSNADLWDTLPPATFAPPRGGRLYNAYNALEKDANEPFTTSQNFALSIPRSSSRQETNSRLYYPEQTATSWISDTPLSGSFYTQIPSQIQSQAYQERASGYPQRR